MMLSLSIHQRREVMRRTKTKMIRLPGGLLFTYIGFVGTGVFMGVWNIVSVVLEYLLLISIYRQHPRLGECRTHVDEDTAEDDNDDNALTSAVAGWKTYFTHPVRNAGLGLSFLYMTVQWCPGQSQ